MSSHHWIQGHCTSCGVKREKVRVQGPCVWTRGTMKDFAKALDDLAFASLNSEVRKLVEGVDPYQLGLALGVPQPNRSIEPHKKRREK